jgi:ribosomal protein S18 acetylase RimI-like enzyme
MTAPELRLRPMTGEEHAQWSERQLRQYAAEATEAGKWAPDEAVEQARAETAQALPHGVQTAGMLFLVAEAPDGTPVGRLWLSLQAPRAPGTAWVYDIEVEPALRGRGYGRALLAAAERELAARGATAVGLNVFAQNATALRLYETSGYAVTARQMRKPL